MNNKLMLAAALGILALGSCNKETVEPSEKGGSAVLTASVRTDADSKLSFGSRSGNLYPVTWDENENFNLSEFISEARSQDRSSSSFERCESDHARGYISFIVDPKTGSEFDYVAITPLSAARTTGSAAAKKGRASYALAPTLPQCPSVDTPDPAACIMTARATGFSSQPKSLDLHFEHRTAYARMILKNFPALAAGESVSQIRMDFPEGCKVTGRHWYAFADGSITEYEGSMATYLLIDPKNVDMTASLPIIWFSCLPVSLSLGDQIKVTATTSSRTLSSRITLVSPIEFKAGQVAEFVYNWTKQEDLVLDFDFSTWPAGWPDKLVNGQKYSYGGYEFIHYGYTSGSPSSTRCTHKGTNPDYMVLNGLGFLSLPVIENRRLVKAVVTHAASKSNTRSGGIVYGLRTQADSVEFVTAGAKTTALWNVAPGTEVDLPVLTGIPGHQYWLCCSAAGLGISRLVLTYEFDPGFDPAHESQAINVGTLNIWQPSSRTSAKTSGAAAPEREWEYARYNIRDIILDSKFDLLAVQEATLRVRNDIQTDLKSAGIYAFEFFLHKPSDPSSSSSVGIIYRKSRFSLSDLHHFWLSDTPDIESQYPAESNVRGVGSAVVTDKQTGRKYFMMVAHASLDDDCNAEDGVLLLERIKMYNTPNLPVILLGDMNANWSMPLYSTLCGYLDDSRYLVELSDSEYYHPGSFNGSGGSYENLKSRAKRIDYVFTRGCSLYNYRVNRSQYTAGKTQQYPSDHCPVIVRVY